MLKPSAQEIIDALKLEPLRQEGGFFCRTYLSSQEVLYHGVSVPVVSAIYYLVTPKDFSAFHFLKRDEIFHFYSGDPVRSVQINQEGLVIETVLGTDFSKRQVPQLTVRGSHWQALKIYPNQIKYGWTLLGATVSPAFDEQDFLVPTRKELLKLFPQHGNLIREFTYDD